MYDSNSTERAVSPTIGIILMVAISVLLAATTAIFMIGLSDVVDRRQPPRATFDTEYDRTGNGALVVDMVAGKAVDADRVTVSVSGAACSGRTDPNGEYGPGEVGVSSGNITAASRLELDSAALCGGSDLDLDGANVRVVWESPGGDRSTTYVDWHGPTA